jgi:hypothetical protein
MNSNFINILNLKVIKKNFLVYHSIRFINP